MKNNLPEVQFFPVTQFPSGLYQAKVVSLDTETCDPNLLNIGPGWTRRTGDKADGFIAGVSFAWEENGQIQTCYIALAHEGGDNTEGWDTIGALSQFISSFKGQWILTNGMYDRGWLRSMGIEFHPEAALWDVQWAEALLDENKQSYRLAALAVAYGLPPKDETLLTSAAKAMGYNPKSELYKLPGRYVAPYAEQDARLALQIFRQQEPEIVAQGLTKVLELEHDLHPLLLEMRWRGVRVDLDLAERKKTEYNKEYETARDDIARLVGFPVEVFAAESVSRAFTAQGIDFPRTGTGKPSFTEPWLAANPTDLGKLVTKARKYYKAANTFCGNMIMDHAHNGRVHCDFHPLRSDEGGTVSGRFSSSDPNLQQVPARDPAIGTAIRSMFLPEEGQLWASCDYSQQEPRLTVHYAAKLGLYRADFAANKYNQEPDTDYHSFVASLVFGENFTPDQRKKAKTINLGLAYGMGGAKLCKQLGLPTQQKKFSFREGLMEVAGPEGEELFRRYHEEVPFIKLLSKELTNLAAERGYITTLSGRRCRFDMWEPFHGGRALPREEAEKQFGLGIKRAFTYKALNRKIQGGSADMIKVSLRNLMREGITPLLTIHDENCFSVADAAEAKRCAEIMQNCVKLLVPLKVDMDIGRSWGEAKPVEE